MICVCTVRDVVRTVYSARCARCGDIVMEPCARTIDETTISSDEQLTLLL